MPNLSFLFTLAALAACVACTAALLIGYACCVVSSRAQETKP